MNRSTILKLAATAASALLISTGRAQTPFFTSVSLAAVKDGVTDYLVTIGPNGVNEWKGAFPQGTAIGTSHVFNGAGGSTIFTAQANAHYNGFLSTGTFANGTVTNAYDSGHTGFDPPHGYVVLGGAGSWNRARFQTAQAAANVAATLHWRVSGSSGANLGFASSRLDFGVTTGANDFLDLYNPSVNPNLMTRFGAGMYDYAGVLPVGVNLDFLFWSSAVWDVTAANIASLGFVSHNLFGFANYSNTFELTGIDLKDMTGSPIADWQLVDADSGLAVFNAQGRVSAVPESGSAAWILAGGCASALAFVRRRRSRS